ncbi:hypothetical protein BAE44_0006821, partial [Dichanthelium oligosanthes]
MDPAPDPLAIPASAPFPTIPAASSPRPRGARPRRHAAPFRSDHPAAAAASIRRSGLDPSRCPAASAFAQQEGSPSVSSWSAPRDASFVFGSGAAGAPEMTRSFSSGSGEASLTELLADVDKLALDDGYGRRNDADVPIGHDPVPVTNAGDPFGARGSNSSLHEGFGPDSLHDQTIGESAETRSIASPTCTDQDGPIEFARNGDSLPSRNSVDECSLPEDGSKISAHGGNVQQNVFVFGGHAGYRDFTANATQTSISKVDSADKDCAMYKSEQLNASLAEGSTRTKFILRDAKHSFGSTNKNPLHSEPFGISPAVKIGSSSGTEDGSAEVSFIKVPYDMEAVAASELAECGSFDEKSFIFQDHNVASRNKRGVKGMITNRRTVMPKKFSSAHQISSMESVSRRSDHCSGKVSPENKLNFKEADSFALEDSGVNFAQGNSYNSVLQITESSHDGTDFTPAANTEHFGQTDFIFSASTFDQSTLHPQRRHNKKNSGGMCNHANSIQSLPSSAIGLAHSGVPSSQQCTDSAAQWTEYRKMEPNRVPVSGGAECTKTENFEHRDDCETWRLRGNQAYAEGQLTKAEECYTHGIDSFSPNEVSRKALMLCYSNRAATRMSLGKMREALFDCREATDIDSSFLKAQVRAAKKYTFKIICYMELDNLMAMKAEALLLLQRYKEVIRFCEETLYVAERNSLCLCPDKHSESNNLDNNTCSVKLWRYHLIAKSYFFLGKLEEAHQFLKRFDKIKVMECRCGKQSQELISSFSMTISELLRLKQILQEVYTDGIIFLFATFQAAGNEAFQSAAYQAMVQILDAIADCSLAIALDADYAKAISRRSSLYELIRDYDQAENDLQRLISLLEKQLQENISMPSEKTEVVMPQAGKFLVRSENISDAIWREITNEIRRDADYLFKIIGKAYSMLSDPTM